MRAHACMERGLVHEALQEKGEKCKHTRAWNGGLFMRLCRRKGKTASTRVCQVGDVHEALGKTENARAHESAWSGALIRRPWGKGHRRAHTRVWSGEEGKKPLQTTSWLLVGWSNRWFSRPCGERGKSACARASSEEGCMKPCRKRGKNACTCVGFSQWAAAGMAVAGGERGRRRAVVRAAAGMAVVGGEWGGGVRS
eukprot:352761-Chlamydomonas_euryale.AAC.1